MKTALITWPRPLVIALGVILTLLAAHPPILPALGDFLVVRDDLAPADLIHYQGSKVAK